MPSIYDLKPGFQKLLQPCMETMFRMGMTPNTVTMTALILSLAGGILLLLGRQAHEVLLLLPVILLVRMALNAIDGMMARRKDMRSAYGEILNEVGDVLSDTLLYTPLVLYVGDHLLAYIFVFLFVFLGVLTEFCGILAKAMVGERRYDGPMGKSDRAFVVGLYSLLLYFVPGIQVYAIAIFGVICILLVFSCWNRLKAILQAEENA